MRVAAEQPSAELPLDPDGRWRRLDRLNLVLLWVRLIGGRK